MRDSDINGGCALLILIAFVALIGIPSMICGLHMTRGQTFTITSKESVKSGNSGKYLIFTDKTTYEVTDTWIRWRFDSSDVYGKLVVGKTYRADLQGFRIPFFSMYQNILNPVEVPAAEALTVGK